MFVYANRFAFSIHGFRSAKSNFNPWQETVRFPTFPDDVSASDPPKVHAGDLDMESQIWIWESISGYELPNLDMEPHIWIWKSKSGYGSHIRIWSSISRYEVPYPDLDFHIQICDSISRFRSSYPDMRFHIQMRKVLEVFADPAEAEIS